MSFGICVLRPWSGQLRPRSSQEGGIMCIHFIGVLVTGFVLALGSFLPGPAHAQIHSAQPAVQAVAPEPIGKVVTATGAVTIEHAEAMVVQANVAGQAGQTKVGDLVYRGDVVQTGADGRVGINFTDGTSFNLSSNARMALNEFVYEPRREIQFDIVQSIEGNVHLRCGQDRENRRYEDRHPCRYHGRSRHHATHRDCG